jgi:type IV pilus assembly protein PilX
MRTPELWKNFPRKNSVRVSMSGFLPSIPVSSNAFPKRQRGVVLILTLIVLVAMTLAAIALVRSVDTGNVVAGNMAFKQGATQTGDAGTEAAVAFLRTGGAGGIPIAGAPESYVDITAQGYYATYQSNLDMTGYSHDPNRGLVDWASNGCNGVPNTGCLTPGPKIAAGADNEVRYIITRLCSAQLSAQAAGNDCVTFLAQGGQSPVRSELKYGLDRRFSLIPIEFYRITSRIKGPRNTISYVETVVHF